MTDMDLDEELAALEKELDDEDKVAKDQRGNNNNNSNLSNNNHKQSNNSSNRNINNNYPQNNNRNQNSMHQGSQYSQPPQQNQKQQKREAQFNNKGTINGSSEDIYPEKQEEMYHKLKEMKSLTVLEEEMALCDKIISFKKKKGLDYDTWETKKGLAELQLNNTKTMIENGNIDFEEYKKIIIGELQYEKKILNFTKMDKKSKPNELKEIIRRINRRIDVIGKELTQNPEEDNGEEENPEPKDNPTDTNVQNKQMPNKSNLKPQQSNVKQQKQSQGSNMNFLGPQDSEPVSRENISKPPQPKEQHHQQMQKPSQNINTNSNSQNQIVNKDEEEKYKQLINGLIREYNEAKEYFKRNGREKLENKSREDLKILLLAKQKADSGKYKEIKLSSLPKPITPEYIYGYSEKERAVRFKIVFTQLNNDKNHIEQKMKSILEKMQKLNKKELEKAKAVVMPKLNEDKVKKDNLIKLMNALKVKLEDKWTTAPEFEKTTQEDKVEKVSYEGCKFGLHIKVGKINYDKDKLSLVVILEASQNRSLKKEVQLKQIGDFNEEWRWEFTGEEWKNIPKACLYVGLYRQHTFSNDKKGDAKISLSNLKKGASTKFDCKIEIESHRIEPIITFIVTPIFPHGKKYYEPITKEVIKITKIYPAFTGKSQPAPQNQKSNIPSRPPAAHQAPQNPALPKTNNNKNNAVPPPVKPQNEIIIDKSKFKPEELIDVDIIDNLNSLKVLDYKIKEIEIKIKKIDGRTPKEILQKKVKMKFKKKQLEDGMADGSISPKDYMEFMRIQLEHDQLLATYMKQNHQEDKMKAVMGRIVLIKQEMEELKKYMN